MGGPRLFAGASAYIITARKMNASATDLCVWLIPSTLVTGTVNRLETKVRTSSAAKAIKPLQPRIGNRNVHKTPTTSDPVPMTATPVISSRLFQFTFDIQMTRWVRLANLPKCVRTILKTIRDRGGWL